MILVNILNTTISVLENMKKKFTKKPDLNQIQGEITRINERIDIQSGRINEILRYIDNGATTGIETLSKRKRWTHWTKADLNKIAKLLEQDYTIEEIAKEFKVDERRLKVLIWNIRAGRRKKVPWKLVKLIKEKVKSRRR